ncbi:MAG TPA: phosphatidylinositol-specific phospholipase C/glycerophosphodiester phosphodiesterase family protein [Tepidisphaeraceae bacterium]
MQQRLNALAGLCLVLLLRFPAPAQDRASTSVTPIIHAHAHNDYEHVHPLFDALDNGFTSVEADVHLIDGKLLVAHSHKDVRPHRTLQSLYLDPLKHRIEANGGQVCPGGPTVVLLIDVKTEAASTYDAIKAALEPYRSLLTTWHDNKPRPGAITVVITGNRSQKRIAADRDRIAACDGELADLDTNPPAELVPWISTQWTRSFTWDGRGAMPAAELEQLRQIVQKCHAQHRKLRFWGSPDFPAFWAVLRDNDVDLINTDHLPECRAFLLKRGQEHR